MTSITGLPTVGWRCSQCGAKCPQCHPTETADHTAPLRLEGLTVFPQPFGLRLQALASYTAPGGTQVLVKLPSLTDKSMDTSTVRAAWSLFFTLWNTLLADADTAVEQANIARTGHVPRRHPAWKQLQGRVQRKKPKKGAKNGAKTKTKTR